MIGKLLRKLVEDLESLSPKLRDLVIRSDEADLLRKAIAVPTDVSVLPMRLSGGREEYYVRITCDGRTIDVRKYGQNFRNRAEYEVAELRHVLLGEPKPYIGSPEYRDKIP